jgi:hypothetical protein
MLPDRQIAIILKKFGPAITDYLKTVGFFDITGPYKPTDLLNQKAMAAYLKASTAKNREVWAALEKWLFPEMTDFGAAFIATYGLKPALDVDGIARQYIAERGGDLIKRMTQTDKRKLTNYIYANSTKNERVLARQILKEPHINQLVSGHRAATIIRTERNHAVGDAAYQMANKAGATTKNRHEVGDHRTRPSHRKIMGEEQPIDKPYSNGEMYPGEKDINCRGYSEFGFSSKVADHPHPSEAKLAELYA